MKKNPAATRQPRRKRDTIRQRSFLPHYPSLLEKWDCRKLTALFQNGSFSPRLPCCRSTYFSANLVLRQEQQEAFGSVTRPTSRTVHHGTHYRAPIFHSF